MTINLDEISKLLGEITQGDWWIDPDGPEYSVNYKGPLDTFRHVAMVSCYIRRHGDKEENEANARLIAAAPTIIRDLVERVRKLEDALLDIEVGSIAEFDTGEGQVTIRPMTSEEMSVMANNALKEST